MKVPAESMGAWVAQTQSGVCAVYNLTTMPTEGLETKLRRAKQQAAAREHASPRPTPHGKRKRRSSGYTPNAKKIGDNALGEAQVIPRRVN